MLRARWVSLLRNTQLGLLSVATLIAETNGFEGFANQRQLVSYAGYDVVENHGGARALRKTSRKDAYF